jgi:hypothetical protein
MAFERAFGPLWGYSDVLLASLHEQTQLGSWVAGMQYGKDNPAPKPRHYPRPYEMYKPVEQDDDGMSQEDFDAQFT